MNWSKIWKWVKRYLFAMFVLVIPILILLEFIPAKDYVSLTGQEELSSREERIYQILLTGISLWGSMLIGRAQCLDSFDNFSQDRCRRLYTLYADLRNIAGIANAMIQTMKSDENLEQSFSEEIWLGLGGILFVSGSLRRQLLDCLATWGDYASEELAHDYGNFVSREREDMDNDN